MLGIIVNDVLIYFENFFSVDGLWLVLVNFFDIVKVEKLYEVGIEKGLILICIVVMILD